jgi:hypothetical protein
MNNQFDSPQSPASSLICSIGSTIRQNNSNDIMNFLIVLSDKHYEHRTLFHRSDYDKLVKLKEYFPGPLHIINVNDLDKPENKQFIIEGYVMIKKLYAKLPKEKIYVDFANFNEKYFNSKINELISIFSVLKAERIVLSMHNESSEDIALNFAGGVRANNIELDAGAGGESHRNNSLQKKWEIKFGKTDIPIKTIELVDTKKFYYLPKESEWIEIIRKRISRGMIEDNYVYTHHNDNHFSTSFFTNLQMLQIDANYSSSKYNNISIEYSVTYYPTEEIQKCGVCGDKRHSSKECNKKTTPETQSFYDKLKNILF